MPSSLRISHFDPRGASVVASSHSPKCLPGPAGEKPFDSSKQITTAYDDNSNRRLIVDGLKRAIRVEQLINKDNAIPELTIMECYGKIVRCIFPIEFMHVK